MGKSISLLFIHGFLF